MKTKKYSTYAEIERDLEILKLEKEICYQKIVLNIDRTKESFLPYKLIDFFQNLYKKIYSDESENFLTKLVSYGFNWYFNKKRGN